MYKCKFGKVKHARQKSQYQKLENCLDNKYINLNIVNFKNYNARTISSMNLIFYILRTFCNLQMPTNLYQVQN